MYRLNKNEEFKTLIQDRVLVYFYADWCSKCKLIKPLLENISSIKIVGIDVDKYRDITKKFGVMSIPCLILFNRGEEIDKHFGLISKEELNKLISNN